MNRSHLFKLLFVLFVAAWAVYEITPLKSRDLLQHFQQRARNRDATFSNIVARATELQREVPERAFANLREAAGTNNLARYFPFFDVQGEKAPTQAILHRLQGEAAGQIKLGLDLQGGTSFLVEMSTNELERAEEKESALANAVEVLRKRVDKLGVAEPLIQPAGANRILIQLPGLSEADMLQAKQQIEKAAFLEFRMVHPSNAVYLAENLIPPGYEKLEEERKRPDGSKAKYPYLVTKKPERGLTGKYLKRAMVTRADLTNDPEILFELDAEGGKLFGAITRQYQPKDTPQGRIYYQLAIVLDGELYSAPTINEPIEGGRGRISGTFDLQEAVMLANVLENPLEAPVKIIDQRTVDPSLGRDSIRSGVQASIIGTMAVVAFMLVYYMLAGLVANVALMANILILMGVLCSVDATLTLPGIAGIVLTVGMAVDANVLIFERIREELRAGKSIRGAVLAGYSKAFITIFDSNLTTVISAVILIYMGTGSVKGFGITLTIGICTSMFTALVITRLMFDWFLSKGWLKTVRMLELIKPSKIDFLRWALPAFIASWLVITTGLGYGILVRGKSALGVDFVGGDSVTLSFTNKVEVGALRTAIDKLELGESMIQYQKELASGKENLRVTTRALDVVNTNAVDGLDPSRKVEQALRSEFPNAGFEVLSLEKVGATVGAEIQKSAIVATLLGMFGILIYVAFRFELSFAVASVVALFHDVLMSVAIFFLAGGQLSAPVVASVLTIIGFSINDTIVIFDRIREDLKLGVRGTFREVINRALNECLSRTIITTGTALMAVLALFLFGGSVIHDLVFVLLVGFVSGVYSTIYQASAMVLWWHKGERPKTGSQVALETAEARV